jgi:hypothetical protein
MSGKTRNKFPLDSVLDHASERHASATSIASKTDCPAAELSSKPAGAPEHVRRLAVTSDTGGQEKPPARAGGLE